MKRKIYRYASIIFICLIGLSSFKTVLGSTFQEDRQYDLVVYKYGHLSVFYGVDIDELFIYAYDAGSEVWQMIPFQIDEQSFGSLPNKPSRRRWFYFLPEGSDINEHDGLLGDHDELAFLARDAGDQAEATAWIDDENSRQYSRVEIELLDPLTGQKAYVYIYRSRTIDESIPAPYDFDYDPDNQILNTEMYSVRLSKSTGLIEDIIIHEPYGNGVDIFDTHKLRFGGLFEFFTPIPVGRGNNHATERDNLYLYTDSSNDYYHCGYTQNPVVRLVREVKQTIRFGNAIMDDLGFFIATKFNPFGGEYAGGALLNSDSLKTQYDEDTYIELDLLRQSFDFNEAATGMHFYNPYNDVIIDGVPDEINETVSVPIQEWTMASGNQGTVFTFFEVADTNWQDVSLYYYDNAAGGQGDGTSVDGGDTGDGQSFGDQGILVKSHAITGVDMNIGFMGHFLGKNLTQSDGNHLGQNRKNPLVISSSYAEYTGIVSPQKDLIHPFLFSLSQNYPNPFNLSTNIDFSLNSRQNVMVALYDICGNSVRLLTSRIFEPGRHTVSWDGLNERGQAVPSGIYIYEVRAGNRSEKRKMIMIK